MSGRHFGHHQPWLRPEQPNTGARSARAVAPARPSTTRKGFAAAVSEALEAAALIGKDRGVCTAHDIAQALTEADGATVDRLEDGRRLHAIRREEGMAAAADMLRALHLEPIMAEATGAW